MKRRTKTWEKLKKEYGVDEWGRIKTYPYFTIEDMKKCCGKEVTITLIKIYQGKSVCKIHEDCGDCWWTCCNFEKEYTIKLV